MINLEFTLEIKTCDDSVQDGNAQDELIRMLENVVERIRAGKTCGGINDFNGNVAGTFDLDIEEDETDDDDDDVSIAAFQMRF